MQYIHKYFRRSRLIYLADCSGLLASSLCFIHCWMLPLLLIFLPGLQADHEWVHPVLCGIALLSTIPILLKKTFRTQAALFQFALVFGTIVMAILFLLHSHLSFRVEMMLNTIGGFSLAYVHLNNLGMKTKTG